MTSPRRLSLAAWLALLTAGVALLMVAALTPVALALLGRLAAESARARAQAAALGAAAAVEREADRVGAAARLLAERPTLQGLASGGEPAELAAFLDAFRRTGGLDGAAVWRGDALLAAVPPALPWEALRAAAARGAAVGLHAGIAAEPPPLVLARAPLPAGDGTLVLVVRRLDTTVASELSEQMGMAVRLAAAGAPATAGDDATPDVYRGEAAVGEGERLRVHTELPASEVATALAPLRRTFAWVAALAALLAVGAGALVAQRLSRPLTAMRVAAQRIGAGDLATPVAPAPGAELSALAQTLEEMRQRLRSLTSELRQREGEAHALLSGIVEGVFAVDGERRIRYLNPQAAAMLGVEASAAIGRFCGDLLRPLDASGHRPCEERCPIVHARSRGSSRAVEHLQLAGGRRTVVITSAPGHGATQMGATQISATQMGATQTTGATQWGDTQVQVMRDETETEAARRSRDAVLANVSHELKTPLSAQLASLELLRDGLGELDAAAVGELVTSLERSTLRLMRLVDNLLESVRIETGQATWRRLPVDLESVVAEAAAMTRPLLAQRRQRLEVASLASLPSLSGDPGQLAQVLVNLLANAHKFSPAGSTIRVGGGAAEGTVSLWVEDSGPGVPPALSTSIFDRFHRAGGEGEGMGLGLWIAKAIVERHAGRIAVSSSPQGGARFTLTFPALEAA